MINILASNAPQAGLTDLEEFTNAIECVLQASNWACDLRHLDTLQNGAHGVAAAINIA
jgi:hypothetical protein